MPTFLRHAEVKRTKYPTLNLNTEYDLERIQCKPGLEILACRHPGPSPRCVFVCHALYLNSITNT